MATQTKSTKKAEIYEWKKSRKKEQNSNGWSRRKKLQKYHKKQKRFSTGDNMTPCTVKCLAELLRFWFEAEAPKESAAMFVNSIM